MLERRGSDEPRRPLPRTLPRAVREALFGNGLFIWLAGLATLIGDWHSNPSNAKGTFLALNLVGLPMLVAAVRSPTSSPRRFIVQVVVQAAVLFMWASLTFDESNHRSVYIAIWLSCGFLSLRALISLFREWDDPDRTASLRRARRAAQISWSGTEGRRVTAAGASRAVRIRPAAVVLIVIYVTVTNYRYASIRATLITLILIIFFASSAYVSRRLRDHQSVVLGEGVLVLHTWTLRAVAFRADRIRAVVLARVRWGGLVPALLLVTDVDGVGIARVWGAEWDVQLLSSALQTIGIAVTLADPVPKRPKEIETQYPGAMQPWELHPVLGGVVILAGCLFLAAVGRAAVGALTGT